MSARGTWGVALLAATIISSRALTAPNPSPPPAEAFGQLPAITAADISPNGKLLARDRITASAKSIEIQDIDTGKLVRSIGLDTSNRLEGIVWSDDQTLLFTLRAVIDLDCAPPRDCHFDFAETRALDITTGTAVPLLVSGRQRWTNAGVVIAPVTSRPHTVMMQSLDMSRIPVSSTLRPTRSDERNAVRPSSAVFAVDTRTGKGEKIATGTADTLEWVVDARGEPIARSDWVASSRKFTVWVRDGAEWRTAFETTEDPLVLKGLSLDGKALIAAGSNGTDRRKAWAIPLDGSGVRVYFEDPAGDVTWSCSDPYTYAVTCVYVKQGTATPSPHWFDETRRTQDRSLRSAFPGRRVWVTGNSVDNRRVVVVLDSASSPRERRLVDFDKSRADVIGEEYPDLKHAALGTVSSITYFARDGAAIPALLTLPPGRDARNLGLVVLPHEWNQDDEQYYFDWLPQFLATRGYAVLQPQYRGSVTYGHAHESAGQHQWGGVPQYDITDGVRHLIANGTVDPRHVCIVGTGFGGYSALWGAAFAPDTYACVASIAGLGDLPLFLDTITRRAGRDSKYVESWREIIGQPGDPKLVEWSPARHANAVKAPVLLLHGTADVTVPIGQSESMERALQAAGKPVRFIRLPDGDHELSQPAIRIQVLRELETFLAMYLQ